jgi:hypothetical protein
MYQNLVYHWVSENENNTICLSGDDVACSQYKRPQELAKGGPLPAEAVGRIYQKLVEEMRNWEATLDAAETPQFSNLPSPK